MSFRDVQVIVVVVVVVEFACCSSSKRCWLYVGMYVVVLMMMLGVESSIFLVLARFGDDLIASVVSRSVVILVQLLADIASTLVRWS